MIKKILTSFLLCVPCLLFIFWLQAPQILNSSRVKELWLPLVKQACRDHFGDSLTFKDLEYVSYDLVYVDEISYQHPAVTCSGSRLTTSGLFSFFFKNKISVMEWKKSSIAIQYKTHTLNIEDLQLRSPLEFLVKRKGLIFDLEGKSFYHQLAFPFDFKGSIVYQDQNNEYFLDLKGHVHAIPLEITTTISYKNGVLESNIRNISFFNIFSKGQVHIDFLKEEGSIDMRTSYLEKWLPYLAPNLDVTSLIKKEASLIEASFLATTAYKINEQEEENPLHCQLNLHCESREKITGDFIINGDYQHHFTELSTNFELFSLSFLKLNSFYLKYDSDVILEGVAEIDLLKQTIKGTTEGTLTLNRDLHPIEGVVTHGQTWEWSLNKGLCGKFYAHAPSLKGDDWECRGCESTIYVTNNQLSQESLTLIHDITYRNLQLNDISMKAHQTQETQWEFSFRTNSHPFQGDLLGYVEKIENRFHIHVLEGSVKTLYSNYKMVTSPHIEFSPCSLHIDNFSIEGPHNCLASFECHHENSQTYVKGVFKDFTLTPLKKILPIEFHSQSRINGTIELSSFPSRFYGSSHLVIEHIFDSTSHLEINTSINNNIAVSDMVLCSADQPLLELSTSCSIKDFRPDLSQDYSFDLHIQTSLETLADLIPHIQQEIKGAISGHLHYQVAQGVPQSNGLLTLRDAHCALPFFDLSLKNFQGKLWIEKQDLLFCFEAQEKQDQNLRFEGKFSPDLSSLLSYECHLYLDSFPFFQFSYFQATAKGEVVFRGTLQQASLTGSLEIDQAKLTLPIHQSYNPFPQMEFVFAQTTTAPPSSFLNRIQTDIAIKLTTPMHLSGYGLESFWDGAICLKSPSLNDPCIFGDLEIVNGRFAFCGHFFRLTSGRLSFNGEIDNKTYLNIKAEADIRNITIMPTLKGQLRSLGIDFQSSPSLTPKEILAHILFEGAQEELTPFQAYRLTQTYNQLSEGLFKTDPISQLQESLNLDILDVSLPTGQKGDDLGIRLGKYINEALFLSLKKGTGLTNDEVAIEAFLSKKWRLRAILDNEAQTALQLRWQKQY